MRSFITTVFFLLPVVWAAAQPDELTVQGQTGGLYLEHTVVAKETWYSVGRLYNVDAKGLAQFNHLTFAHPLVIGETLKVPLTKFNFSQDGKKLAGESLIPVYHVVQEKEWLYRISVNHNKVPIPVLEKWNHVTGDQVHVGLHMIVGYLKVKTALSALAKGGVAAPASVGSAGGEAQGRGTPAPESVVRGTPKPVGETKKAEDPKKAADSAELTVVKPDTFVERKSVVQVPAAAKPPPRVSRQEPSAPAPASATVNSAAPKFNGGKFKAEFSDGGKSVTGQAGIFKSTSGWQDGKYYALINNVPVGTIVKITDQGTGKSVFAKVLGQLPDMKESAGLMVRLSNAAAAELGEEEAKFSVGVSY